MGLARDISEVVEHQWIETTTDEALEEKREIVIPKLFGPEYLKTLSVDP